MHKRAVEGPNIMLSQEERATDYTPEETALVMRLRVFVNMRWLVVLGIVAVTIVASRAFDIRFPTLPVYVICAVIALYNLLLYRQVRSLETEEPGLVVARAGTYISVHIFLDLVTLTVLLHYTGGIENPFMFFYFIHAIAASIVLPPRRAYGLATFAVFLATLLVFLEYAEVVPHVNLEGFVLPYRYRQLSRVLGVLAALVTLVYASTYLTTAISGELRRRRKEVVRLRDQLLEKKTQELEETAREVAKLQEEKRRFVRFLSVVAHDLRAPLSATQSCLWVILDGYTGEITEEQRDLLERSTRRIDGLLVLVGDLLDIPRIEAGQLVHEMADISFREVVERSVDGLDNLAREKGITFSVELPRDRMMVHASGSRLQQVVTNLASNAINYTGQGSVLVRVSDCGDHLRFETLDSGIGITAEDLPQLFDDFFRGRNVESKGTGLGLSISKRIVEAHGGRIWAESPCPETNSGSKFTFTLPKRAAVSGEGAENGPAEGSS